MTDIYLDFQATTPIDPIVLEAMMPWLAVPANPHAVHAFGRRASGAVKYAREQVAAAVGAEADQVVFTSGSTEAANIALRSVDLCSRVAVSAIEHACVRETVADLEKNGTEVVTLPVDQEGLLDVDAFGETADGLGAACVMMVNNEVGTVQPIETVAAICRTVNALFLSDITQAVGRLPIDMARMHVDAAWLSSHKIYGPQGIGAVVWRAERSLRPITTGGGQERKMRPGTVPTALAVGFGAACELAIKRMERDAANATRLAQRMLGRLRSRHPDILVNGSLDDRIPHNLNIAFPGIDADALVGSIPDIAISTGSACSAGALRESHVLQALECGDLAPSSIRIGFGRTTSEEEVDRAASRISEAVDSLRDTSQPRVGVAV